MRTIKENHRGLTTVLAFALIPLSGFATDIYLPSLPAMATWLHVPGTAVQLSLVIFMVSSGISQLFVGSLLDSFGRFRLNIAALAVFALASFIIALSRDIYLIYLMRVVHGITVAIIVVSKRAYFVDMYSGDKLKHYTSLFSIIWASAPIIAPFLGGFLQASFGWQSNFYFLGFFTLAILFTEFLYGGESLKSFQRFNGKTIFRVYTSMMKTADYTLGLFILGLSYSMLMVYGMASPFIIEKVFRYSPVITGNCALLSGVALMAGGTISKLLIKKSLNTKIVSAVSLQFLFALAMIFTSQFKTGLYTMMPFVLVVHLLSGFVFNNLFSYCLGRFSKNAGIASGITGGSMYIITSFFSSGIIKTLEIKSQGTLGVAYVILALFVGIVFFLFTRAQNTYRSNAAAFA
ncbi:MFS transporter [Hufsiella ginkgonis]|uniref:MFS transporter n=1 Tax=Hufsiella ginkgonis TaxID=2695274 RepID=A0A7K1XWF6_9SPHI|nr:MFS transporter [Hufsiella ginkgonis]MXV15332.1 MFS transporter [Hufsiella ginkgonis]